MVLDRIPAKPPTDLRLVTFNINGVRTLFHYHPWTRLRTLGAMFSSLHADIVTLQELKVSPKDMDASVGKVDGYHSFISLPQLKKGYSGVGVYVRIPKDDEPLSVRRSLKVVKAEEGITGVLKSHDSRVSYNKDSDGSIGGYPSLDEDVAAKIDSEGRCVVIELAINTVVISVYCPANSMATEEGEQFRVQFLEALLARIRNLKAMGKEVVLMGDINIARDLIDRADALSEGFKAGLLRRVEEEKFEESNKTQALRFIQQSIPRLLLNEILLDSTDTSTTSKPRVLIDTTRKFQGRRQGMYTVWNTMLNSRPGNFGSRIDLILATESLAQLATSGDIWPFLMGSDHCPVYTDFDTSSLSGEIQSTPLPKLEAKYVYKLSTGSIHSMFAMAKKRGSGEVSPSPPSSQPVSLKKPKITVSDQKKEVKQRATARSTPSVMSFFKAKSSPVSTEPSGPVISIEDYGDFEPTPSQLSSTSSGTTSTPSSQQQNPSLKLSNGRFMLSNERVPECKHKEPCILKTAKTSENKGKKFWTCARDNGEVTCEEDRKKFSCGFFQWK